MLGRLGIEILAHPVAEVLDRDAESLLGLLEPLVCCLGGQSQYLRQGLFDIVLIELVAVALFGPDQTGRFVEGLNKALVYPALGQVALHVCDVWVVAAESLMLVENAQEDIKDRIASVVGTRLAVDVEQDDIGAIGDRLVDICANHRIAQLVGIEEGNSVASVTLGIPSPDVSQQVGQGFQEVRLTRAEEAADPDAYAVGNGGIRQVGAIGLEEAAKVFFQLVGNHILVELLVHGGVVRLVRFDHTIDGAVELLGEDVFNAHGNRPY